VAVLTQREIANQEIETYKKQRLSQEQRIEMERAKGRADMQALLAQSKIGVEIKSNDADARKAEAEGEATYLEKTGAAKGAEIRAVGLARAEGFKAQVHALGANATAVLNVANALAEAHVKLVPDVLVTGGNGLIDGFVANLMKAREP